MTSQFVRKVPRYPRRFLPETSLEMGLSHQVDLRPAQFAIGLEERPIEKEWLCGEPVQVAQYLGRVEEVSAEGEVVATLWECPSGREALSTLDIFQHFEGKRPRVGDLLHVWTWMELCDGEEPHPRVVIQTETRELDESARARLRHLLEGFPEEPR